MGKRDSTQIPKVRGLDDALAIVKQLVCDEHTEGQLVLGIDWAMRLCGATFRCPCERCSTDPMTDADELVAYATDLGARELMLVTFVEPERLAPTPADVARFEGLRVECAEEDVELLDHILMSGHRWRSIRELSAAPCA